MMTYVLRMVLMVIFISSLFQSANAMENAPETDESRKKLDWIVQLGFCIGGDKLAYMEYEDGHDETIKAGELMLISGGFVFPTVGYRDDLETQLTIGWKFDSVNAKNGKISFTRFPLEAIQFFRTEKVRFGAGITYHISPSLNGSGIASKIDDNFDNSLGFVIEVDYMFSNFSIGCRYSNIDYSADFLIEDIDGSSFDLMASIRF